MFFEQTLKVTVRNPHFVRFHLFYTFPEFLNVFGKELCWLVLYILSKILTILWRDPKGKKRSYIILIVC